MTTLAFLAALAVLAWITATLLIRAAEHARAAAERILCAWEARRDTRG